MPDNIAMRDVFGEALVEIGAEISNLVVIDADVAASTRTGRFADVFPDRFIEVGIAEQNGIGIAAGLSTTGFIPFMVTFGVFASKRVLDQVSISVAYPKLNVKIAGAYSGLFVGKSGATHQALEDITVMRAIPNMTVVEPSDPIQLRKLLKEVVQYVGPAYFRVAREVVPSLYREVDSFSIGKAVRLKDGCDLTIVTSGVMVAKALEASEILEKEGIYSRVIDMHTIKPIDKGELVLAARETGAFVTVENHSVVGGLGGAVAEVLAETIPSPLERLGVNDKFGESGSDNDLLEKYGLTANHIVGAAKKVLRRKKVACGQHITNAYWSGTDGCATCSRPT